MTRSRTDPFEHSYAREGTFYIHLRGPGGRIFRDARDALAFEKLIVNTVDEDGMLIHAYCWTPEAARLLVELDDRGGPVF